MVVGPTVAEAKCRVEEGLSNYAGVALETLHADSPSLGNTPSEQRSPDAMSNPIRMSGEMANMALRTSMAEPGSPGRSKVQPLHPTTVPSGGCGKVVGTRAARWSRDWPLLIQQA